MSEEDRMSEDNQNELRKGKHSLTRRRFVQSATLLSGVSVSGGHDGACGGIARELDQWWREREAEGSTIPWRIMSRPANWSRARRSSRSGLS